LHYWAWLVQHNGDYDKAEQLWLRALAIDRRLFGENAVQTTRRVHLLANLYRDQGEYQKATPLLQKALALREKHFGPAHIETGQILTSLGRLYMLSGDFAGAETALWRAVAIFEKDGTESGEPLAGTLSTLGWLYLEIADLDQADEVLRRSLELHKKLHGIEHMNTAGSFRELALLNFSRHRFEQAATLFRQSLAIRQRLLGPNHLLVSELFEDLGTAFLAQGDLMQAEEALQQARSIVLTNLGCEHPRVASIGMVLSRVEESRGNYGQARNLCAEAHQLRERILGASHHATISSLRRLAALDAALGRSQRALASADQLQASEDRLFANIFSFTSERQRLAYQEGSFVFTHRYDLWADLGAAKQLARTVVHTKGLVLDSLIEDRLFGETSVDQQIGQLRGRLSQAQRRLSEFTPVLAQRPAGQTRQKDAEQLSVEIESLQASLARRVTTLGRPRRALLVKLEQVLSSIPQQTILIELLRYRHDAGRGVGQESYGALVLSQSEQPKWVPLGASTPIDKSVKLYQHAVRNPDSGRSLVDLLENLYLQLWTPLLSTLPGNTKQIIISPDSELNFISFATLLTPERHFLGEDYLFSYVSCSRDLVAENKPAPGVPQLSVWANPDFGEPNNGRTSIALAAGRKWRDLNFGPLPGAEQEGRELCSHAFELGFSNAVLHVGAEATEAKLFCVQSPKVLHLATHAFVLPEAEVGDCEKEDFLSFHNFRRHRPNPLLRSGLALAGAQRTLKAWAEGKNIAAHNDGIVTADEISELDLRGTELVVLSGCDTGTGEARAGEGVLGLRRGFIQAGAQNLLLTLWPIDDQETVGFMRDFYAQLKNTSPSAALAQVQRTWLKRLRLEKGVATACGVAGPFILSFQGPDRQR